MHLRLLHQLQGEGEQCCPVSAGCGLVFPCQVRGCVRLHQVPWHCGLTCEDYNSASVCRGFVEVGVSTVHGRSPWAAFVCVCVCAPQCCCAPTPFSLHPLCQWARVNKLVQCPVWSGGCGVAVQRIGGCNLFTYVTYLLKPWHHQPSHLLPPLVWNCWFYRRLGDHFQVQNLPPSVVCSLSSEGSDRLASLYH